MLKFMIADPAHVRLGGACSPKPGFSSEGPHVGEYLLETRGKHIHATAASAEVMKWKGAVGCS